MGSPATTPMATWTTSPASSHPTIVVTVVEDDPADENYAALQENLERLRGMRDQDGRPLTIETLPMPRALHHDVSFDARRLEVTGAPVVVLDDIMQSLNGMNTGVLTGAMQVGSRRVASWRG